MDQFQVIFAPRAERDLQSITFFIARQSSAEIAERFGNRLIDRALTLATLPERGRIVPEFGNPQIREIIFKIQELPHCLPAPCGPRGSDSILARCARDTGD
jgi:plasmid stabilization system protein ParE